MTSRPPHLTQARADRFKDQSVVDAYPLRWPYPPELFQVLADLMTDPPGIVLDVGTGTGDVARPLNSRVGRVDAVDADAGTGQDGAGRRSARLALDRIACRRLRHGIAVFARHRRRKSALDGLGNGLATLPRVAGAGRDARDSPAFRGASSLARRLGRADRDVLDRSELRAVRPHHGAGIARPVRSQGQA